MKGETRRERNTKFGQDSPEIDIPEQVQHVWEWFWAISARRRTGPEALTFAEVDAWRHLTRTDIRPEEVEMIMQMDDALLFEVRKEQAATAERARDEANRGRR